MRWVSVPLSILFSIQVVADDMSVDQAVTRLLKDIKEVEFVNVPVPVPVPGEQHKLKKGKANQTLPSKKIPTSGTHRVRRGETLDMVIRRIAPNSKLQKIVLRQAFVKANPHAFRRNNPNWLYAGAILKVPDIEHLRQVVFKDTTGKLQKDISGQKAGWIRFP
jgi:Tfp pilus assembly protein FimV